MAVDYVAVLKELSICGSNSCDKEGNCAHQKKTYALFEQNWIGAAKAIAKCGYVSYGSGEWTEADAKIYVESHLTFMSKPSKLTLEQKKLMPAPKRPMSEICAEIRQQRSLERRVG